MAFPCFSLVPSRAGERCTCANSQTYVLVIPWAWVIVLLANVAEICETPNIKARSPMVPEWKRNAKPIETNIRLYDIYIYIDLAAKLCEEMDGELKTLLAQVWSWDVRHGIAFYSWYMSSSEVFPNFWGGFKWKMPCWMMSNVEVSDVCEGVEGVSCWPTRDMRVTSEASVFLLAHSLPWWAKAPPSSVKIRKCMLTERNTLSCKLYGRQSHSKSDWTPLPSNELIWINYKWDWMRGII